MKFDQDLCLNLQYDFGKMNSTLGSVVPLAMFLLGVVSLVVTYKYKNKHKHKLVGVAEFSILFLHRQGEARFYDYFISILNFLLPCLTFAKCYCTLPWSLNKICTGAISLRAKR